VWFEFLERMNEYNERLGKKLATEEKADLLKNIDPSLRSFIELEQKLNSK